MGLIRERDALKARVEALEAELAGSPAAVLQLQRELAEVRAALSGKTWSGRHELNELERAVVEETLAWQAYDRARPAPDPSFSTVPFVRWSTAVDRLIAHRAKAGGG